MPVSRVSRTLVAAVLAALGTTASAGVMTFGNGSAVNHVGFAEDGLTIVSAERPLAKIYDWQTTTTGGTEREMLFNSGDGVIRFEATGGGTFDLLALDVENPAGTGPGYSATAFITVVGSNGFSRTISASSFGTVSFGSSFSDISWFSLTNMAGQGTVDNIRFDLKPAANVPEPGSLALAGLALLGLIGARRAVR